MKRIVIAILAVMFAASVSFAQEPPAALPKEVKDAPKQGVMKKAGKKKAVKVNKVNKETLKPGKMEEKKPVS